MPAIHKGTLEGDQSKFSVTLICDAIRLQRDDIFIVSNLINFIRFQSTQIILLISFEI